MGMSGGNPATDPAIVNNSVLGKGPKKENYESFDICQTVGR